MVEAGSNKTELSDYTAIDIEKSYSQLATTVRSELDELRPLADECTIHRVPDRLRQLDENSYRPRVVSIGPIHHGREEVKAMEEYKRRYLQNFLQRSEVSLEYFIKVIKEKEEKLRNCYGEAIELDSDGFVKMVLMDAAFIIEVLRNNILCKYGSYDRLYANPHKIFDVVYDMYMLENQLPFFILEDLFALANINITSKKNKRLSLLQITRKFTKCFMGPLGIGKLEKSDRQRPRVNHLVHFLRICMVPSKLKKEERPRVALPSVTGLHQAGVKFRVRSTTNLFEVSFRNGILEIPRIRISSPMELILKNLLAFEQCQCNDNLLNDYVTFLNCLVRTTKDVELLVQREIIENLLGDNKRVTTIFQNLVQEIRISQEHFYFSSLFEDLNGYCRRPFHRWKATLKQEYFKTPWTTISVIAATILLILTFIQTVCSINDVCSIKHVKR